MPKALPGSSRDTDTHDRIHVILLIQDLDVRIVNAITGELLKELRIDPNRDY